MPRLTGFHQHIGILRPPTAPLVWKRAVCGDISLPSKRLACSRQLLSWVRKRSLALAAISLLSSVLWVLEIHCAAVISGYIAISSSLTRSMHWSAVSSSGLEEIGRASCGGRVCQYV